MKVIGITGGIGSGKSTAAKYLSSLGFACIDADQIGRELTEDGKPVLELIRNEFGAVYHASEANCGCAPGNGLTLDRKELASIVFTDPVKLERYNEIIHGEIIRIIDERIADLKMQEGIRGILLDAPLIYEAGIDDRCDAVILITADADTRISRVTIRDGASEEDVRSRIARQMSDDEKKKLADFIVDNSGTELQLDERLDAIIKYLKA